VNGERDDVFLGAHDRWRDGTAEERIPWGRALAARPALADDDSYSTDRPLPRTWRQELPRWLATLNSARTRREYEKAVLYFFLAPGIPEALEDLTHDLLLAYRGSLALRADRHLMATRGAGTGHVAASHAALPEPGEQLLPPRADHADPNEAESDVDAEPEGEKPRRADHAGPLAPATVNVRLTALRQFLTHCSLWGLLPQLTPERIRAALRRLSIERRRPYQILAEPEWAAFLRAAQAPAVRGPTDTAPEPANGHAIEPTAQPEAAPEASGAESVWGIPRALRRRLAATQQEITRDAGHAPTSDPPTRATTPLTHRRPAPVRSRAGLTGAHTAQRDHALLALALATGLRAIELCALDLGDLAREWHAGQEEWWLVLPDVKTKGQHGGRTLPLAPDLVRTLLEYVRGTGRHWEHAADRATPLFLSLRQTRTDAGTELAPRALGRRLSTEQVRRIVDRVETQWLAAGAGHKSVSDGDGRAISPHALRHSTAVALLEGNERSGRPPASVEHVRGWLGHFDIRTTQGYLAHLDARRQRRPFALQPAAEPDTAAAPASRPETSEGTPPTAPVIE
jgi:site-specific recombinase XerD